MNTPDERISQDPIQDRTLTTTSFAVLAVLSLRDHSTYDITRQVRKSMHYMWPRAESNVYAEPMRLVEAGLVSARQEWNGRRRRTIYSITDDGLAALARWLASPSGRPRYECEALVKILFAENGTPVDLLASIRSLAADATEVLRHFLAIADEYDSGAGEYPWRFALSALAARLLQEQQAATLRWAAWAEEVVAGWETPLAGATEWGIETMRSAGQALPIADDPVRDVVAGRSADEVAG